MFVGFEGAWMEITTDGLSVLMVGPVGWEGSWMDGCQGERDGEWEWGWH